MSGFRLSPEAEADLDGIWIHIARETSSIELATRVVDDIYRAFLAACTVSIHGAAARRPSSRSAQYTIRSERMLMEQLEYNLLFRWFVGLNMDEPVWVPTVFSKNRDRLMEGDIAERFFGLVLAQASAADLVSDEHFSVDGTLIEAWATLVAEYYDRFIPATPEERCLVDSLIRQEWLIRRYSAADASIFNMEFDKTRSSFLGPVMVKSTAALTLADRRINSAQRNFSRALKDLMSIRAKRGLPELPDPAPESVSAPPVAPTLKINVAAKPLNGNLVSFPHFPKQKPEPGPPDAAA